MDCLPVVRSHRVADTTGEDLAKSNSVLEDDPALVIDIELSPCLSLAELEGLGQFHVLTRAHIVDRNWIRLVAAAPNYQVCSVDVGSLQLRSLSLHQANSFLSAMDYVSV